MGQRSLGYVLSALLFIFLIVLVVVASASDGMAENESAGELEAASVAEPAAALQSDVEPEVDVETNVESSEPCGNTVTLRDGETLFRIAQRCETTVDAILARNPDISDVTQLSVGQTIALPGGEAPAANAVGDDVVGDNIIVDVDVDVNGDNIYTLQPGDTLSQIARQRGLELSDLLFANPEITNPDSVRVGQQIVLPD